MRAKSLQSCLTLYDPLDCSPPGFSVHGILQARILEWVAVPSSSALPIQFSRPVVSECLRPHGLQHARFPCPSPTPGACSNSYPSSRWCHLDLVLCRPLLLLPSIFPSIRVFSNELVLLNRWSKYWSFSFSNSPSDEHSGLISFRIYWFDLLAVQGTLKSLLQHHSSKASIPLPWLTSNLQEGLTFFSLSRS